MPKLELVIRGVKGVESQKSKPSPHQPITPGLLSKMRRVWLETHWSWDGYMLWVASTLFFFGFFRSCKIMTTAHLLIKPTWHSEMLRIHLKQSKTDPFTL